MTYPPEARVLGDPEQVLRLVHDYPVAYLVTAGDGPGATRIPVLVDAQDDTPVRLRAHINRANPQARLLDGAEVLVVFPGPASYVSPHWRSNLDRAGTIDYEEVRVRGRARIESDFAFFTTLVDDLAALIEPQHAEIGDYPVWKTDMAPDGYIERLFPHIVAFSVAIDEVRMVSKLHQGFPAEDRRSIVEHLSRSSRDEMRQIAARMRALDE